MTYRAPVAEMSFTARLLGQDALAETERYGEATPETRGAILAEAAKLAEEVMAPVNRAGDLTPAWLENGVVRTAPGYSQAYRQIAEGGWVGISARPENGGMGLPVSLSVMVGEMMASACLSLSTSPLLTQGQIEALEAHGPDWIKALWLPKLVSGAWNGTMNLTEPQAGTDVGAVATRAVPSGEGCYRITGQKIYISWGDHDFGGNTLHLVLARLPGAPKGTRGLSLFLVPKLFDFDEGWTKPNAVRVVSLEKKLGQHGAPTCAMAFEEATGWLIGEENDGMACMFTMMNNARLNVGIGGLGIAETATQRAIAWSQERRQGQTPDGSPTIIGHADVRRMLLTMISQTRAARAICYDCACSLDLGRAAGEAGTRAHHEARGAALTPIAKAFGTDTGVETTSLAMQIHGGMGYIEETGIAQLGRDVRISTIYEGTNGIQAMDLVGRKLSIDGGAAVRGLLGEVAATVEAARGVHGDLAVLLESARATTAQTTDWMLKAKGVNERFAGAVPYLRMLALVLGAHHLMRAALDDPSTDRVTIARFFVTTRLPEAHAAATAATQGSEMLYAIHGDALTT